MRLARARNIVIGTIVFFLVIFWLLSDGTPAAKEETFPVAKEAPDPAKVAQAEQEAAEEKVKGFHCLSSWDGSNRDLIKQIKAKLGDPDSFSHTETTIAPVNDVGNHILRMDFRAANALGGKSIFTAWARIDHETCKADIISIKNPEGFSAE
ncbi:hypothetical protein [Sphingomonas hengshuiensis]|uniref:Uncharacterized protein n=1 Tax=Sphingomonas hengshuiensis TaxID=1609977 RepID=A0A7U4JAA2_9SPHN|nr:hypothetical protein [Sphingomonas hengshuiensis]AJP73140.1 hypothetical protein TS85_17085 [Sphingomonas hengshuiensis]